MPRRPRPAHRAPPKGENSRATSSKTRTKISNRAQEPDSDNEEFGQDSDAAEQFDGEDNYSDETGDEGVDEDEDADAPRVVQWVDEDELAEGAEGTEEEEEEEEEEENDETGSSQLKKLQKDFSNLPFGALRKAQSVLGHAEAVTDSEDEDEDDTGSDDEGPVDQSNKQPKERVEWSIKPRTDIAKRANKHAPTEVTSKRPVGRLRQVVEVKKQESRDPRFIAVTGEFREEKFQHNYGFLTEAHKNELKTLRENLKRARKLLQNAPRHLREEYEQEVERLEQAVKRAESIVNKDRMESIRREALHKASKEEKEKRKLGKGSWYLKESEKRELITRAKYETLAAEGGQRAVKKAIEKRQKKIGQKEKKSRPFPKSGPSGDESRKRRAGDEGDVHKRRRVGY